MMVKCNKSDICTFKDCNHINPHRWVEGDWNRSCKGTRARKEEAPSVCLFDKEAEAELLEKWKNYNGNFVFVLFGDSDKPLPAIRDGKPYLDEEDKAVMPIIMHNRKSRVSLSNCMYSNNGLAIPVI